jgi:hypothetical protein
MVQVTYSPIINNKPRFLLRFASSRQKKLIGNYMRRQIIILIIGFSSCGQTLKDKKSVVKKQDKIETKTSCLPAIGDKIQGDFNGDGHTDFVTAVKIKEEQGNPVEDGAPEEYEIQFSSDKLKSIKAGCCDIRLINEGDLNNDGADEISIFQAPMNGCTYSMTTYSLINGTWKQIVDKFLIPTGCDSINDDDLQKRIFKENTAIYYLEIDMSDENGNLIKKKAISKSI